LFIFWYLVSFPNDGINNQSINKTHLLGHQLPMITGAVQVTQ